MPDRQHDVTASDRVRVAGGDHTIDYLDAGPRSSRAVVLLHSLGTDHRIWRPQLADLARQHRVITPDIGRTPSSTVSVRGWVDELGRVLDHAGVADAVLVGVSLGGIQAIAFTADHPERVAALVVADSFVELDASVARAKIDLLAGQARREGMAAVADSYVEDTFTTRPLPAGAEDVRAAIAEIDPDTYVAAVQACFGVRLADRLARISAPTLVLWGDRDAKAPRSLSERIVGGIDGARFVVVPGAGHMSNIENPEAFTRLVAHFVAEHARGFVASSAGRTS